jgi:glycosyltransferase involved in cell wall biosynthesis
MRLPGTWRAIDRSMSGASLAIVKVPGMLGALATLSAMRRRVPTAAEVVGDAEGVLRSGAIGRAGRLLRPFVGAITRWVVRRAKAVRYVTDRQLQHQYPPSSGAVTFAFSDVVIAAAPRWQPKDDAAPRLVSIGSVDQLYKGHHLLIEALKGVREAFPDATLTVVGSGRRMPFLHEVVERNELGDAVLFPGYLSPAAEVESVLVDATLFVLPSLTEGMPRALVEAMALGVPAVASRVGGVPELLPPSATFAPGDVDGMAALIIDLHRSEERRRDLSEAGIAVTRRFSASVRTQALREWQRALVRLAAGE